MKLWRGSSVQLVIVVYIWGWLGLLHTNILLFARFHIPALTRHRDLGSRILLADGYVLYSRVNYWDYGGIALLVITVEFMAFCSSSSCRTLCLKNISHMCNWQAGGFICHMSFFLFPNPVFKTLCSINFTSKTKSSTHLNHQ